MLGQIKLMINHCVILNAIGVIKYDWTPMVQSTLWWQTKVAHFVAKNISFGCLLMGPSRSHDPAFRTFFKELVFAVFVPILVIIWLRLLVLAWPQGSAKDRENRNLTEEGAKVRACCGRFTVSQTRESTFVCAAIVTVWHFQPSVASYVFASFSCIEKSGQQRLYQDLEIICWEGQHLWAIALVSIPAIIFWIIGPIVFFFQILRNTDDATELV